MGEKQQTYKGEKAVGEMGEKSQWVKNIWLTYERTTYMGEKAVWVKNIYGIWVKKLVGEKHMGEKSVGEKHTGETSVAYGSKVCGCKKYG